MAAALRTLTRSKVCAVAAAGVAGVCISSHQDQTKQTINTTVGQNQLPPLIKPFIRKVSCEGIDSTWVIAGVAAGAIGVGAYLYTNGKIPATAAASTEESGFNFTDAPKLVEDTSMPPAYFREAMVCVERGDFQSAARFLEIAADTDGYARAQAALGAAYEEGKGVTMNKEKAAEYYTKAAMQGLPDAMVRLGTCYDLGVGVAHDVKKANELFQAAADRGDAEGAFYLSWSYVNGEGVEKDVQRGTQLLEQAARAGHPKALQVLQSLQDQARETA
eukprot:m.54755 g.54755  ORF g.54755 m.54755 type:complete len:275 (-) comp15524_c0_seq1:102-926(-)